MTRYNTIQDDEINFDAYMLMTDHAHKVKSAGQFAEDVESHFHDHTAPRGPGTCFTKIQHLLRFRPHEVTLWAGYSGHGKSLLLGQSVIGFAMQGEATCIASMEMKPITTLARMTRQAARTRVPDKDFIAGFCDAMDAGLYLYDHQGMVERDRLVAVIRYAAEEKHCKHFVIDSLMKCGIGEDDYNAQKHFLDCLCTVARDSGIHIHLVVHSRKAKDEMTPPGKHDIRGGASISDQADNVLIVWRNKAKEAALLENKPAHADPDAFLFCGKQRNGEWEGALPLFFDTESQQFSETQERPRDLLDPATYRGGL